MEQIFSFFSKLFSAEGFPARWYCGKWTDFHGWLYILSDLMIWGAYFTIPLLMWYFVRKRKDVPYQPVFWYFMAFIFFCGATHLVDAIIFWEPLYRLSALLRFLTAVVSWLTVLALYRTIPKALKLSTPTELEKIIAEKTQALEIANQKLKESEEQFRTLVNSNPDVIAKLDQDFRHIFVNDAILRETGLPPEHFTGKTFHELDVPAHRLNELTQKIEEAWHTKQIVLYETDSWNDDVSEGDKSYFSLQIVPLLDSIENTKKEVLIVNKNITVQKKLELQLKAKIQELETLSKELGVQNKQLEEFANITSHNLRAPIGNLNALYDLYLNETKEDEKSFYIEKIGDVSKNLMHTIDDLAEIVKIKRDTHIEREILYFEKKLTHVVNSLTGQILETGAEIDADFSACPTIEYPKVYLESILLNLISNAIKYRSPERKPKIFLQTQRINNQIVLTCQDNGLGMDLQKYGHKIFKLYKTFHRNEDARGIGLYITKNQVEALGGEISVSSEINVGTTFTIIFNKKA